MHEHERLLTQVESTAARGDVAAAFRTLEQSGLPARGVARALDLRARLLLAQGRIADAATDARRAAELEPASASFTITVGWCHEASGEPTRALECFRRAVDLSPGDATPSVVLGTALVRRGDVAGAVAAFRRALAVDPENRDALDSLVALRTAGATSNSTPGYDHDALARAANSNALSDRALADGDWDAAAQHALDTVRALPDHAPARLALAAALADAGDLERALRHFGFARDLEPGLADAAVGGARVAGMLGLVAESDRHVAALDVARHPAARLQRHLRLPAINDSVASITAERARYDAALEALLADPPRLRSPESEFDWTYFFLSYHGEIDRTPNSKLARLVLACCPSLAYVAPGAIAPRPARRRIRVGFASRFLRMHSIGKTTRGLVDRLDRRAFEVYGLCLPPAAPADPVSRWIAARCDRWIAVPESLAAARATIAALDLDVLYYQDVGMESFGWYLSFSRLAPVQCVSFGHPDTTGVPTLDYFVSTAAFETEDAADHYSERLHRLPNATLPAYYLRPELPTTPDPRAALGLPAHERLYVCPQSPFKLHPDVDALFAGILRADPGGRVLLAQGACRAWAEQLTRRFARTIPDVAARVGFLPRLPEHRFYELLRAADVILDTPHFNGMNTSLEAFAAGTPIVTLPSQLQRGRHTRAMYARMELMDCVATSPADYVAIALRLAREPDFSRHVRDAIRERAPALFEERAAVEDWQDFLRASVAAAAQRG